MSDRSEQALRERLELAKKATPEGERTLWTVDGAVRGDLCIRDAFNERLLTMEGSTDMATACHIAASSPDIVRADLEEILELRADVARSREREEWLARHLAYHDDASVYEPFCPMPMHSKCEWQDMDLCRAKIGKRAECWRKLAEMETQENPGSSGEAPENPGEGK